MKLLALAVIAAFTVTAHSAFAATDFYDLEMKLSINGKHVFSPSMFVEPGESASIAHQVDGKETFIEVVATEGQVENKKGIMMNFTIGTISADGKKTIVSKPRILVGDNSMAEITSGKGDEQVSLSVVAQRKAL